uniref:ATPase family AAA domain containing 5a n=1 Tax=Scophthalmus maximus TaxID=52904 RepID=A0A8D3DL33_SCOMX
MVINEDQALPSSNSTVRISFEEFVRSQSQDEDEEEMDNDQLRNVASGEPILQVSPRTVTIQAEVHAVSPKQEAVKAGGKLASIFNKRKGGLSPAEVVSSPQTQAEHQLPSTLLTVRRKSNVVLQEEDLELAVLESESTPKCSVVERKQFMAAFKQPSQDGSKTKPGKSQGKKQPEEKNLDAEDKVAEEESTIPLSVEQIPDVSHENNVAKKKSARKNKKKAKKENEALTTSLAPPPVEEAVAMNVDDDEKIEEPVLPAVRRSRREAVVRQATETTAATPIRTNRKQNESKEADGALSDCPAQMSTPKTRKSKHGVFVAEMDKIVICFQKSNESKKRKQAKKLVEKAKVIQQTLPPCDTGCTESRLGLLNVEPERDIWELLRVNSPYQSLEEAVCWEILIGSRRRGVDLLYSNMETLLPLPLTQFTASIAKPDKTVPEPQDDSSVGPKEQPLSTCDCSDDGSPVKVSKRMKKNKRRHRLPGQDGVHSDSDSEDGFQSLCKLQAAPQAKEVGKERLVSEKRKRKPLTPEERIKSVPVSQCLDSIAEFLDNMSYMDSSLLVHPEQGDIHRRISPVGAAVKDGMTDESRVETDRGSWSRAECVLEMQAAVEALSFRKCRGSVAEAWDKAQQLEGELGQEAKEELTLPVASHREEYSFCQDVMERLMLRGVVGTLGNRAAAALDYLPVLRTICRSEQLKEKGKVKRRFLHYLDAIHLGLEKNTLQFLAENFP